MLYSRIMVRLLQESKLDSLANSIGRSVMSVAAGQRQRINSARSKREGIKVLKLAVATDVPASVVLKLSSANEDSVKIGASWDWNSNTLEIRIIVNSVTGDLETYHLKDIQTNLYDAVRHELEHSTQGTDLAVSSIEAVDRMMSDPASIEKRKNYYTDSSEVPALTSGIYNKAKKIRKPFSVFAGEYIDKIRSTMIERDPAADPESIETALQDILTTWTNYAKVRFPQAII